MQYQAITKDLLAINIKDLNLYDGTHLENEFIDSIEID